MSSTNSINSIHNLFKAIFEAHPAIDGRYSMGPDLDLNSKELQYPRVQIVPGSSQVNQKTVVHTFAILCVDIAKQDDTQMIRDVWSDTHQILVDVVKFIRSYTGESLWFDLLNNPVAQPVLEDYRDRFTGHQMTLQLEVDLTGPCDIPILNPAICGFIQPDWNPSPTGSQGPVGTQGPQGPIGPTGPQGFQGDTGSNGLNGVDGSNGLDGVDGSNALRWSYKFTSPPGDKKFTTDVNDFNFVQSVSINEIDINGNNVYRWLRAIESELNAGRTVTLKITNVSNTAEFGIYNVRNFNYPGSYYDFALEFIDSSGGQINDDNEYSLSYVSNGANGPQGNQGIQGPQGFQGIVGNTGPQGNQGIGGSVGPIGFQGYAGTHGSNAITWTYFGNTPANVGGSFYTDNSDLSTLNAIAINEVEFTGGNATSWLANVMTRLSEGRVIYLKLNSVTDPSKFGVYSISVSSSGYDPVSGCYFYNIVHQTSGSVTTITPGETYAISYTFNGTSGINGAQGPQGVGGVLLAATVSATPNQTNSTTTLVNVAGSPFTVVANAWYEVEWAVTYNVPTNATGIRLCINGSATQDYCVGTIDYSTLTSDRSSGSFDGYDTGPTAISSVGTTGIAAYLRAKVHTTGAGNLLLRFNSESSGQACTIVTVKGSIFRLQ